MLHSIKAGEVAFICFIQINLKTSSSIKGRLKKISFNGMIPLRGLIGLIYQGGDSCVTTLSIFCLEFIFSLIKYFMNLRNKHVVNLETDKRDNISRE